MFQNLTPVVRALLLANIIVFGIEALTNDSILKDFGLWPLGGPRGPGAAPFEPWQLVSYAFLHGGWMHLFSNMLALWMFGPDIERILGPGRFAAFYLTCVIGAAATQLLVTSLMDMPRVATVGASGGIFGILLFFGLAFPQRQVMLLILPIPVPAWLFVTLYGAMELYLGVTRTQQGVAHFAHLGGMASGWLLIRYWMAEGILRFMR